MSRFQRRTAKTPHDDDDPVAAHHHHDGHDFEIPTGHVLGSGGDTVFEPHIESGLDLPRFVPSIATFGSSPTYGFGALDDNDDNDNDGNENKSRSNKTEIKGNRMLLATSESSINNNNDTEMTGSNIFSQDGDEDGDLNRLVESRRKKKRDLDPSMKGVTSCGESIVSCWRFVAESWKRILLFVSVLGISVLVLLVISSRSGNNPCGENNNNNTNNYTWCETLPPSKSSSSSQKNLEELTNFDLLPSSDFLQDFNEEMCDVAAYRNLTRLVHRVLSGASQFVNNNKTSSSLLHLLRTQIIFCVYKDPDNHYSTSLKEEAGWSPVNDAHDHSGYHPRIKGFKDAFSIDNDKKYRSKIVISASTRVAASRGFYWYLKHVLNCQVTWGADQLDAFMLKFGEDILLRFLAGKTATASEAENGRYMNVLPLVENRVAVISTVPWRHAWNMVTFGYTSTWWDWQRWERELDWMALHGVNLPLAFVGQEYVWIQAFAQYGILPQEMEQWFAGPAFLPWQRGGNVMGFGGPLPMQWIIDQRDLQRKILKRMREFGMTPVLPCFAGHVPAAAKRAWPTGTYTKVGVWNNFPSKFADVLVIDPTDVAFHDISAAFMSAQAKIYGLSGYYSCDTFNENDPQSDSEQYLAGASKAVVDGIVNTDPNGVWLMQAWLFSPGHFPWWQVTDRVRRYVEGAHRDHFIILDLHAEDESLSIRFNNFYGKASIWCMLHNYGGVRGMYGDLNKIAHQPFEDMATDKNMVANHLNSDSNVYGGDDLKKYFENLKTTVLGFGFVPESIEQNPIVYELMTENFFGVPHVVDDNKNNNTNNEIRPIDDHFLYPASTSSFNTTLWVQSYLSQRYANGITKFTNSIKQKQGDDMVPMSQVYKQVANGEFLSTTWKCWNRLLSGFYSSEGTPRTELEFVPQIGTDLGTWKTGTPQDMFYSFDQLLQAVLDNEVDPERSAGLHYDAIDIARQAATMYFTDVHVMWIAVGKILDSDEKRSAFDKIHSYLLDLIRKLDDLLGTDKNFLLGVWMDGAKKAASTTPNVNDRMNVEKLFKYNAKNQITMWGPTGQISDYAAKSWSGLYRHYYLERYNITGEYVKEAGGMNRVNSWTRDHKVLEFEVRWNNASDDDELYPTTPNGKTWRETAVSLMNHIAVSVEVLETAFDKHVGALSYYPNYELYRDFSNMPLWTHEPRELAKLCLLIDMCVGFSGNGYLFTKSISIGSDSNNNEVDLWLKKGKA